MEDDPQDGGRVASDQQSGEVVSGDIPGAAPGKVLTPAARRALEEAAARKAAAVEAARPPEDGGPAGPEPTRYGDWERKGVAVDF